MSRPISRAPRQRFSGRLLGERSGSWWKTIPVQSAYRPAVLEWERASDPRSPLERGVLCGGAPDFHGMLSGLLHGMVGDRLLRLPHSESFSLSSRQSRIGAFLV